MQECNTRSAENSAQLYARGYVIDPGQFAKSIKLALDLIHLRLQVGDTGFRSYSCIRFVHRDTRLRNSLGCQCHRGLLLAKSGFACL